MGFSISGPDWIGLRSLLLFMGFWSWIVVFYPCCGGWSRAQRGPVSSSLLLLWGLQKLSHFFLRNYFAPLTSSQHGFIRPEEIHETTGQGKPGLEICQKSFYLGLDSLIADCPTEDGSGHSSAGRFARQLEY